MVTPNPLLPTGAVAAIDRLLADQRSDTCAIQRRSSGVDGGGAPSGAWGTVATVACRVRASGRQPAEAAGGARFGPVTDYDVLLPRGTAVTAEDRIVVGGRTLAVVSDFDAASHGLEVRVVARAVEA